MSARAAVADPRIIPPLVTRHAGDAAFYWAQHDASIHSPLVDFAELRHFDRLLDAHLEGLAVAGEAGAEIARRELARWQGPGEFFVCAIQAFRLDSPGEGLRVLWPMLEKDPPRLMRGLISALAWTDTEHTWPFVSRWLKAEAHPPLQVAAWRAVSLIGGTALEQVAPLLRDALNSAQAPLRAAACRCANHAATLELLVPRLGDPAREVRAEAAIALAGRLSPEHAASALWRAVTELNAEAQSLSGWPRSRALHRLSRWVRHLGLVAPLGHPGIGQLLAALPPRQALAFALHHGDAACLPWVAAQLDDPRVSRQAGWVWSALTGLNLEANGLARAPRALKDDEEPRPTDDLDPGLPEPDAEAIRARSLSLPTGVAILGGAPITAQRLTELLGNQPQALRWIAAQRLRAFDIHFDTRAPAQRQLDELAAVRAFPAQAA